MNETLSIAQVVSAMALAVCLGSLAAKGIRISPRTASFIVFCIGIALITTTLLTP